MSHRRRNLLLVSAVLLGGAWLACVGADPEPVVSPAPVPTSSGSTSGAQTSGGSSGGATSGNTTSGATSGGSAGTIPPATCTPPLYHEYLACPGADGGRCALDGHVCCGGGQACTSKLACGPDVTHGCEAASHCAAGERCCATRDMAVDAGVCPSKFLGLSSKCQAGDCNSRLELCLRGDPRTCPTGTTCRSVDVTTLGESLGICVPN